MSLVSYGALFTFPQILMNNFTKETKVNSGISVFTDIIITSLVYSPFTIVSGYLSELKILGRKYSMAIGFVFSSLFALLAYLISSQLTLFNGLMQGCITISYIILPIYDAEIYPTKIRTIGIGSGYTISRIGGITAPYICEFFFVYFDMITSYLLFFIASVICIYISHKLPYETHQTTLDNVDDLTKEMDLLKS